MWRMILMLCVALTGFWFGSSPVAPQKKEKQLQVLPEKEYPLSEHKSFVIMVYAHNQELWCERALRSVFEQDYDHYRVVLIDDGSIDQTEKKAKQFIVDNNQDDKVIFIRNETRLGPVASLYRAIDACLDREIIIPLDAKDWLSTPKVLDRLNLSYQNPDVWLTFGQVIDYPSYAIRDRGQISYYAALFKQLRLNDLFSEGQFVMQQEVYILPLQEMSGGRICNLKEPVAFANLAAPIHQESPSFEIGEYSPLASFPEPFSPQKVDILIFSNDKPIQLYACLESVQRYISNFEHLTVLYKATHRSFGAAYEKVKSAFPLVRFVEEPKGAFQSKLEKIVFGSPSKYILFGTDELIVKDFVDLKACAYQIEKTGAYGFYFRFGRHLTQSDLSHQFLPLPKSHPLSGGIYAWDLGKGEAEWGSAPSLEMTLFHKQEIQNILSDLKCKSTRDLEIGWAEKMPQKALGLYFERSKLVRIQSEGTGKTAALSSEEMLAKFNQGLKIDIDPLYKVENRSAYLDYLPEFVMR